jgi:hypothetical protein
MLHDPAVLVRVKPGLVVNDSTDAFTVYPPLVLFEVNVAVACPEASVTTEMVFELLENLPLAPLGGAVNVTVKPCSGLLPASATVATSGLVNAVLNAALCPVPLVALMEAGAATIVVESVTVSDCAPPPLTVTLLTCGELAVPETLTVTVIAG